MLGNEFDTNGLYQAWSPLFDYNFMEESKKLPFPSGKRVLMPIEIGIGISIEQFVQEYKQLDESKDQRGKIDLYNRLIRYINEQTPELIKIKDVEVEAIPIAHFDDDNKKIRRTLVKAINSHNLYQKGLNTTEAYLKNFISNKLQTVIQGVSNFIGSHAPISLDAMHEAADNSSYKAQIWTSMNPGYIPLMQTMAMVGKKGVGIAANGQKAGFIWKYWMTDSITNNNPYKEYIDFPEGFHIDRIEGRFGGNIEDRPIKRLPDINMNGASDQDKIYYSYNENHYIPSDQMSSQMISAATDNAKELILDKINANTDLSKIYMYLITLGFDVKDIVSFMTSPAIDIIAKNSTQNIFLDTNFRTKDVANFILNKITAKQDPASTDFITTYSIDSRYSFVLESKVNQLLEGLDEQELNSIRRDIVEFLKIYELSEEFSYAGRFLGINGGIPQTKESLMKFNKFIKDIISSREVIAGLKAQKKGKFKKNDDVIESIIPEDLRDLVDNIDSNRYLSDKNYRDRVIRYYNLIKGSLNILALVEGTEQFQTILEIANILNIVDNEGVVKSKASGYIYDKIIEKYPYTSVDYSMQILPVLNQIFISEFVKNNPVKIPVKKDWKYLTKKWNIEKFKKDGFFTIGSNDFGLTTDQSISSFHYIMDNYFIPMLKSETFNGIDFKNNAFIRNLIPMIDGEEKKYKINIDMRAALNNPESKILLTNIIKGLQELQNYKINDEGTTLLDLFMLYSLAVDQMKQGSDRMTDLFSEFVNESNSRNNLLLDYYNFMGTIEQDNESFMSTIKKLSVNGFLVSLANKVVSEEGHNEPSVKVLTPDGRIDYMFSLGFGKYNSFGDFLPNILTESPSDKMLRKAYREQYKFGQIYDGYILDILDNFKDFTDNWLQNFKELMADSYITVEPDCD